MLPSKSDHRAHLKRFAVNISMVILLFISALFTGIYLNHQKALDQELKGRAQALFNSIIITRKWNALHGGVFVEKTPGMVSNPYLQSPDITASNGKTYTKKNPALMTREISEIADKEGAFQFHITSLRPLNPGNAPDTFERQALLSFAQGKSETILKEKNGNATYYRYMAPLFVEESCLSCHADQGYRIGDVRGGISIRFNIEKMERALVLNKLLLALLFTVTLASLLGIVFSLVGSLKKKLAAAEETIREMATTDELTKLKNRRFLLNRLAEEIERATRYRHPLSCIFFDADHFKEINDTYGHEAGDEVLKTISTTAQGQCRLTDILGRYGGEEFLMILPETEREQATALAERLRQAIEHQTSIADHPQIRITATFGVACYSPETTVPQPDRSVIINQADAAMLEAKKAGRNRVGIAP
ncbi:diguanylate cyclase [Thiovibrio frasassiensis]|uniref:diguanylate cyclase n=1 Tax=Thiovibrio frasassiensis TaxID=2984131 RepID=A0A9X4MK64_9BACT|nr:diguanylate cyclase [Thiovibrio frasassiensis]MDG4476329.1 diguanylate cyclase [Thiovibrio frasassiensis]